MSTQPDHWEAVKALFEAALEEKPASRSDFLAERCTDAYVRAEVERLLVEHDQAGAFLSTPPLNFPSLPDPSTRGLAEGYVLAKRFRILRFVAGGGMGEVYEAEDQELHERVAIKTIRSEILAQPNAVARFKREVHLARQVTHPNVCRIYDLFRHECGPGNQAPEIVFISMELLRGKSLSERLKEGGCMKAELALPLVRQLAAALGAAHSVGIVHRDFKPGNVVLVGAADESRAVVTDFGLALQAVQPGEVTSFSTGVGFLGTPAYMSPEQLEGRPATPASDIYALGLVIYEMMTGARPFKGETPMAAAMKRLSEAPTPPHNLKSDLSPLWESAILRCLERDPSKRFASAADVEKALLGEETTQSRIRDRARKSDRKWAIVGSIVVIALLLASSLLFNKIRIRWSGAGTHARRSVAVLGFKNLSERPQVNWVSSTVSEELSTELAIGEKLRTISGEDVARMRADLSLPDTGSLSQNTLSKIRQYSGSDLVVYGSYLDVDGSIRLDVRVQDAAAGETLASLTETAPEQGIASLIETTGAAMRQKIGIGSVDPDQQGQAKAALPSNMDATRMYAEGLEKLRSFDPLAARDLLEKAISLDPKYALAHAQLSEAWSRLGYDERARQEAKEALDLAGSLPPQERLLVQARYWTVAPDRPKAIETYRALVNLVPDNLDYGLLLAQSQILGAKPNDALTTVDTLRKLPQPDSDDPRLDLAASKASYATANFADADALAARAFEKSKLRGATLLMATALLERAGPLRKLGKVSESLDSAISARKIYASTGDRAGLARAFKMSGNVERLQGNLAAALNDFENCLQVSREIGDRRGVSGVLGNIAIIYEKRGDSESARKNYEEELAIATEIDDKTQVVETLNNLAGLYEERGETSKARDTYEKSLKICQQTGNRDVEAVVTGNIGFEAVELGDIAQAKEMFEQALGMAQQSKNTEFLIFLNQQLGNVMRTRDELDKAKARYGEAAALADKIGDEEDAVLARMSLGQLEFDAGHATVAEASLRQGLDVLSRKGGIPEQVSAESLLAECMLARGKMKEAHEMILKAQALIPKLNGLGPRFAFEVTKARVLSALGKQDAAEELIHKVVVDGEKHGYIGFTLEARLAEGEIELKAGKTDSARAQLKSVEKDARSKGFLLIARRAVTALSLPRRLAS